MGFRSILISEATRINLNLNSLVVYYKEENYYIDLDEIDLIIVEDPRCLVSLKLLTTISEKGITLIFTDDRHMPISSLNTLVNNSRSSQKIKSQIEWNTSSKEYLWTEIIKCKTKYQRENLINTNNIDKINIIDNYIENITLNDKTNMEGLVSRTYFKELFGKDFKRFNEDIINNSLNYTYQIIRAKIAQEIASCGYNTSLGINHKSEYNYYNLADDFIEPYRPIADFYLYNILKDDDKELNHNLKERLTNILNEQVTYKGKMQKISYSITLYVRNMFNFLETGDTSYIIFPQGIDEL